MIGMLLRRIAKLEALCPSGITAGPVFTSDALDPKVAEMLTAVGGDISLLDLAQLQIIEADIRRLTV